MVAGTGAAYADKVERSGQSILPLFEPGGYAEVSFGHVKPSVTGKAGGADSGNVVGSYWPVGIAYKQQMTDAFSLGFIYDRPFGANVNYPRGTGYPIDGTTAELRTDAFTILGNYRFDNGFGVHGGVRIQRLSATADIIFPSPPFPDRLVYRVNGASDEGLGYVLGVSYEIPEIALRMALTYNSEIKTKLPTSESFNGVDVPPSTTAVTTPQSVNLDLQTGIAQDTLLFGGIRWVDYSAFVIDPQNYPDVEPLLYYRDDTWSYSLGVGRRFTENWSGSLALSYEKGGNSNEVSNLGPTNGQYGVTLGARYEDGPYSLAAGVNYMRLGDATTQVVDGQFDDNDAVGIGIKLGYRF
ncbi:hypothetical protein JAO82_03875 [Pontibaca sp. S1109L]|uniref:Uncharacterized protein n=2 Tax=Pontibaca salina TaxID=2795731 RepID=A0A934HIX5_9RHOB|nr:hypothetical protein [Pontibaca salina]